MPVYVGFELQHFFAEAFFQSLMGIHDIVYGFLNDFYQRLLHVAVVHGNGIALSLHQGAF